MTVIVVHISDVGSSMATTANEYRDHLLIARLPVIVGRIVSQRRYRRSNRLDLDLDLGRD